MKYAVLYDRIRHDCGYREVLSYGLPKREYYDNGMVSDKQMDYFETIEKAEDRTYSFISNNQYKIYQTKLKKIVKIFDYSKKNSYLCIVNKRKQQIKN